MDEYSQPGQSSDNPKENGLPISVSEPLGLTPQEPETEQKLNDVEREMSSFERSTLRWTKATFFILGVTCIFIGFQWHEMKNSSKDTANLVVAAQTQATNMGKMFAAADQIRQAAQGMVTQEQRIADNAQNSIDASISAAQLDERAWLFVDTVKVEHIKTTQTSEGQINFWRVRASIGNQGKTPAKNAKVRCWQVTGEILKPITMTLPYSGPTIIVPGQAFYCGGEIREGPLIGPGQIPDSVMKKLTETFSIVGSAVYSDVYKRPHWLKFCYTVRPDESGRAWSMDPCEGHPNDTGDGPEPPN